MPIALEKPAGWSLLGLLTCTAWARSGIYGPWHGPLWILFALFAALSAACFMQADAAVRRRVLTDPLLIIGLLLSLLLFIQWRNAGGHPFVNIFTGEYSYTPPPLEGWPFSVEARLSRQPLAWFTPVALFLPVVRHLFSTATRKRILWGLVANAVLLALFGLVQFGLGWTKMFGFISVTGNPPLLSTFEYSNHGGTFFYLLFAVSIGLLWDAVEKQKSILHRVIPGLLAGLFAVTALCSLSRAAVLAVIAISLWAPLAWIWKARKTYTAAHWINAALFGSAVGVVLLIGILRVGDGAILREFSGTSVVENDIQNYEGYRGFQIPPALKMVKEHPWFGVGGWGYRCFVRTYLPRDRWGLLGRGKANVHCDPVQFLAEHGIVGFGLMTAGLAVVLAPWRRFKQWRFGGLALMTAFGASLVALHSLIDLPFRNPTILWHWLLLLTIVPLLAERSACGEQRRTGGQRSELKIDSLKE